MKAYDIYRRACAIMFEREGEDDAFVEKFPELLNALAAECLMYENSVRETEGRAKLATAPIIKDNADEVDMCDEICSIALPYGIASYFYQDDGEDNKAQLYRERFVSALHEAGKCCFRNIENVYGGEVGYDV